MELVKVSGLSGNAEFVNTYVGDTCLKQIEKNLNGGKLGFKNQMLRSLLKILESSKVISK